MIRAYKFLLRPTVRQAQALSEMLRDHCSLYNAALQERRDAYRHPSKTSVKYGMQSAQLKDVRAFDPERQGRWSFSSQQATLRRLDKAFAAFFCRVKSGDTPGYPRFRGVNWFDTGDFPKDGDGCRFNSTPHDPATRVRLQGVGHVKVHQHRAVAGRVKTVSVKREGRKWFVVLTAEQDQPQPLPPTGTVVGTDLGIANFLADSGGGFVPNPRHGRKAAAKLEAAQQALSRFPRRKAKDRTANHQRAVDKTAQLHGKVRRQLDHAHKTALGLVRAHDFIAHEDLKIRNMSKAPTPRPDPDQAGAFLSNGAAAKAGLNTSISDAGWGVFLTILHVKAESAGREVIAVDPRNTSRTCPACGHTAKEEVLYAPRADQGPQHLSLLPGERSRLVPEPGAQVTFERAGVRLRREFLGVRSRSIHDQDLLGRPPPVESGGGHTGAGRNGGGGERAVAALGQDGQSRIQ